MSCVSSKLECVSLICSLTTDIDLLQSLQHFIFGLGLLTEKKSLFFVNFLTAIYVSLVAVPLPYGLRVKCVVHR